MISWWHCMIISICLVSNLIYQTHMNTCEKMDKYYDLIIKQRYRTSMQWGDHYILLLVKIEKKNSNSNCFDYYGFFRFFSLFQFTLLRHYILTWQLWSALAASCFTWHNSYIDPWSMEITQALLDSRFSRNTRKSHEKGVIFEF